MFKILFSLLLVSGTPAADLKHWYTFFPRTIKKQSIKLEDLSLPEKPEGYIWTVKALGNHDVAPTLRLNGQGKFLSGAVIAAGAVVEITGIAAKSANPVYRIGPNQYIEAQYLRAEIKP
jgi:hypothetical protein